MRADECPVCGEEKDFDAPQAASDASFVTRTWSCCHCGSTGETFYNFGEDTVSEED